MATECNTCGQGPCPTPQACELRIDFAGKEPDEPLPSMFAFVIWMLTLIIVLALISFIAGLSAGYQS